ncbi:MAG: hypothetical protein ABJB40_09480 [Acidobacteriota bacterium]
MNSLSITLCGIPQCGQPALLAAILGTQRFCMVPAMADAPDPLPFVRYNLCDGHLIDLRRNFTEVKHDPRLTDYRDIDG